MEEQEIVYKDIDDLILCNENPRVGYTLDDIDAIHKIIAEQGDKIVALMKSLVEGGWLVGELPGLYFDGKDYRVYEGNRRIAALKCFFNISLLPEKNKISNKIKKYISTFSEDEIKELRKKFTNIPCVLYAKKEDAYRYMEKRHTPNNGKGDTLEKWNTISNELFKNNVMGKKTLFGAVYSDYRELFSDKDIPPTTLTRILNSSYAKEKLGINFNDDIFSVNNEKEFRENLKTIIHDIELKKVNSRILSKVEDIADYIDNKVLKNNKHEEENKKEEIQEKAQPEKKQNKISENQLTLMPNDNQNSNNENKEQNKIERVEGSKKSKIKIPQGLWFSFLETKGVDKSNLDNFGILYVANELKEFSKTGDYKKYPSAAAMLIRNLLEQSLKYQLKKKSEWDNMLSNYKSKSKNNIDREPGLEYIVNYCMGNINKIFPDNKKIQNSFRIFGQNLGTKDYLNGIVHNPEIAPADYVVLEKIARAGLYKIIFYILDS